MKPFEAPVIHIELFQIEDVITTSGTFVPGGGDGNVGSEDFDI